MGSFFLIGMLVLVKNNGVIVAGPRVDFSLLNWGNDARNHKVEIDVRINIKWKITDGSILFYATRLLI